MEKLNLTPGDIVRHRSTNSSPNMVFLYNYSSDPETPYCRYYDRIKNTFEESTFNIVELEIVQKA